MMTVDALKSRIESLTAGTKAEVSDLTGGSDHFQAVVISPAFQGKLMMEQHRIIYSLFQNEIDSGEVHALTLKTYTPEQYKKLIVS